MMSVQAAMDFIQFVRAADPAAQRAILASLDDDLQAVVQEGSQLNFDFSADDLRAAFRHDWQRRWLSLGAYRLE